jgi:cellulose synthase/poly-beta-1,6-N-acetylglucosamine synthase-like glycosyltransferase
MAAMAEAPHLPTLLGRASSALTPYLPSKKLGEFHAARAVAKSVEKASAEATHSVSKSMFRGSFYVDSRPVSGKAYFPMADAIVQAAVVVCMYNEDAADLSRTLESLVVGPPLDIVVVADGLEKLSDSAREYLIQAFDLPAAVLEDSTYDQIDYKHDTLHHQVFISDPVSFGEKGSRACVLLKRFNHRKINSLEWFFKAHAPNTGCPYSLTTDCGAFFRPGAVEKLIMHLSTHERCVAVTARQRVMSEYNHRILGHTTPERDTWLEWALRMWQGFDYELDSSGGKATDCTGGLTVCLHGPCAMFRLEDIQGKCLEEFFDEWGYAPAYKLSLYGANLQLGEDRVLSLLSATASAKHLSSLWDAVFEFDPELSLQRLVTQRRRWKNSIMCHTYYTLTQMPSVMRSSFSLRFKLANLMLLGAKMFEHVVALFCSCDVWHSVCFFSWLAGWTHGASVPTPC